ncbi:MAG: response regulator, partial [Candidatus Omnitrophica bacterium]|nr:response regulator [Candidatus Omnitrophota bacterium]
MPKEIQVLFLDDEESIIDGVQRLFIREPYGIFGTTSPDQAREAMAKEKIKVVVSDYRMPDISGVEFLREVKGQYPDIVKILFTGYTDFSAAEEAINVGEVYRFISKPWKTAELLSTIRQCIEHYDLVRAAKTKEEELEFSNKKLKAMYEMQKEFTSTVSHELRTPLESIKTAIDLVVKRMVGEINQEQEEVLGRAK